MKLVAIVVLDVVKPLGTVVAIPPLPRALDSAGVPATTLGLADLSLAAVLPPLFGGNSRMSPVSWGMGIFDLVTCFFTTHRRPDLVARA